MKWQPIETYPKRGELVLVMFQDQEGFDFATEEDGNNLFRTVGFNSADLNGIDCWHFAGWDWCHDVFTHIAREGVQPTHWCPLPGFPKE